MVIDEFWKETLYSCYGQYFNVDKVLYRKKSSLQELIIFKNRFFGNIMALDGIVQTTEKDEFIYHEMMSHVPMLSHGKARHVLILGGGDGGILREIVQYPNIKTITMVEIDTHVINICQRYLPHHNKGSYDDPRVNLIINDGTVFLKETKKSFDVIISDCTDPIGPGKSLFTSEFYKNSKRCLNPGGIIVAQNGVHFLQESEVISSYLKLRQYFNIVKFYQAAIPTYYGGSMVFCWATDKEDGYYFDLNYIKKNYSATGLKCRYYNPNLHLASFSLPQHLKNLFLEK